MSIWTTVPAHVLAPPSIPVLSVGNLKGGVGKTTVVSNLAVALVQSGVRVLAIDLDFQASLSVALPPAIMPRYETSDGAMNVLLGASYDMFHDSQVTGRGVGRFSDLSLVRTSIDLADVEDRSFAAFILGNYAEDPRFSLARKLSDPRLRNDFDVVILDTPPRLTMASINALCACTHVLIPTSLTAVSQNGAITFVQYLANFRKHLCPGLAVSGLLPTFTHGKLSEPEKKTLEKLQGKLPNIDIWDDVYIPTRQDIANNRVQYNVECKDIFRKLAAKVINKIGIGSHGHNEGQRAYRGSSLGGADLS